MANDFLIVANLGERGVNVDASPLHLVDNQFRRAQNLISDPLGVELGLKNRPGLTNFNDEEANAEVLGGQSVPLTNLLNGTHFFYIGRGPTS